MALGMAEKVGMTSVMAEDEEGETSSESSSEPDEDLLKTEDEEEMEDEETDEEAAAAAEAKKEAAAARWNDGLGKLNRPEDLLISPHLRRKETYLAVADQLGNGGVILVLFEMPSGFAVFRYDGIKLLLPDARQNIWADFVHDFTAKHVIHLLDIGTFEDKGRAINEDTGVSEALGKMILGCHKPGQKIAVGNMVYKRIIESNMDIVCLCCPAVDELMWGLKISLRNFVPTERSGLTNEDRLPMSQGMRSFLNMHNFDIEPDMMVVKDGSAGGQRYTADFVKKPETFAKNDESSSYIFDDTDTSANMKTNSVSQPTYDDLSNKPFSIGENRLLEKPSKDSGENLDKRKVQLENNEFKLNPNAKSFIPSASLRPLHPPLSYYYPNNMPAAPLGPGLQAGLRYWQQMMVG
nr:unnamed protein product [Digitaria exilis]